MTDTTKKDDILGLNFEGLFLATVMGTKLMLRSLRWSGEGDSKKLGPLQKGISVWSQKVIIPGLDEIVNQHDTPLFAREVLRKCAFSRPYNLHILLLMNASKHLMDLCESGLGPQTMVKVRDWFGMMKKTTESQLCKQTSRHVTNEFNRAVRDFSHFHIEESYDDIGHPEYPYFDPHGLYIQVAYMVYFYTTSNEVARPPSTKVGFNKIMDEQLMCEWELHSGELFDEIFMIYTHGLHITDQPVTKDYHFSLIKLPYKELRELVDEDKVPSVLELHQLVMRTMSSKLHDISSSQPSSRGRWRYQTTNWTRMCAHATALGKEVTKSKIQNREKVHKNYIKYRKSTKTYAPRDPDFFERDIHIMGGLSSLFYLYFDPVGREAQSYMVD